jgi:anti-sigma-K factor RskA
MKLADRPERDALCGEYLLGTLRGPARRRFARALRDEPRLAARLLELAALYTPRPNERVAIAPRADGWERLRVALGLPEDADAASGRSAPGRAAPDRTAPVAPAPVAPEPQRARPPASRPSPRWTPRWLMVAGGAATAMVVALLWLLPSQRFTPVAELAQTQAVPQALPNVIAALAPNRRVLQLKSETALAAASGTSFEVWVLPAGGGAPRSLGVLDQLDGELRLAADRAALLGAGAKLAISLEPVGGSPTGAPTGPVVLIGDVTRATL